MTLNEKQFQFTLAVADLIQYIYSQGYTATFGCARCKQSHHKINSFHNEALAIDINLFKDGIYLKETAEHAKFGAYWILRGGTWGGNFKHPDGNHYSWGETK